VAFHYPLTASQQSLNSVGPQRSVMGSPEKAVDKQEKIQQTTIGLKQDEVALNATCPHHERY
jgi:hypothetical protein